MEFYQLLFGFYFDHHILHILKQQKVLLMLIKMIYLINVYSLYKFQDLIEGEEEDHDKPLPVKAIDLNSDR